MVKMIKIDEFFHIEKQKWDLNCFHSKGYLIYYTHSDESKDEIADYVTCGQPNIIKDRENHSVIPI